MTTNIPSYPRHIRAVQAGVHASRRPRIQCCHSLCVKSRKKSGFVDFGGLLWEGATKTVLSFESCRGMHILMLSNEDGQKGALLSF